MASFPLKIVCPDGVKFDGQAQQLSIRTTSGELGILARHTDCVAPPVPTPKPPPLRPPLPLKPSTLSSPSPLPRVP